jgi:uncharacterized membrane protein
MTHHQRVAMTQSPNGREIWLNLVFLFLIVLIPISISLRGLVGRNTESDSVVIYGTHLALITFGQRAAICSKSIAAPPRMSKSSARRSLSLSSLWRRRLARSGRMLIALAAAATSPAVIWRTGET